MTVDIVGLDAILAGSGCSKIGLVLWLDGRDMRERNSQMSKESRYIT